MAKTNDPVLEEFKEALVDEWGTYVANGAIDIDGVRAFNEGDAVPASHVSRGVVRSDQVIKAGTTKESVARVEVRRPAGATDMPSPEDIAAAQAANKAAGVE